MTINDLLNRDIVCSCGKVHRCNISAVEIGKGALNALPGALNDYKNVLLVADANTYPLCADTVKELVGDKICGLCYFDTTSVLVPDEKAIAKIDESLSDETDFILGIGSGVINDLCKYVSHSRGIKSGIVATAPSMDGYASSGAAMIIGGMKITYTTHAPDVIIGDTDIMKSAPIDMIRAGYGDIIGKYSSLNDWELANLIRGEHFCQVVYDIVKETADDILASADAIAAREDAAIEKLMRALVLSGITLTLVETTRPGSGSEHHLSHFFEISGLIRNKKHLSHGEDVAYTTILTAGMREEICKLQTPVFCEQTEKERLAAWDRIFAEVAPEVKKIQDEAGSYTTDLTGVYQEKWEEIKAILSKCPTSAECNRMMKAVGLDFSRCESLYGKEKIRDAMLYGKDLKNRYSMLWIYYSLFSGHPETVDYKVEV